MPQFRHHIPVKAPLETVWELLLDKVEHPQRYIESVLEYTILDRSKDWVLREMKLPGQATLRELVVLDERDHVITFTLIDHPCFEGEVTNRVSPSPEQEGLAELEFAMDWRLRAGAEAPEHDPTELIRCALEHTREIAEELARAAGV